MEEQRIEETERKVKRKAEKEQRAEKQKQKVKRKRRKKKITKINNNENILRHELEGFFMDIPEVKWVKFNNNSIYVGFSPYPIDGEAILKGAALHGNQVINFSCHVWAVHADQKNNSPYYGTMNGKWYKEVTARYGRIR